MKFKEKNKKNKNIKVLGKQIAFVMSSGITMISCVLLGYFIGNKLGSDKKIISILVGSTIGMILFISDIFLFFIAENKTKNK